jgi:hypothetical protein
MLAAGSVRPMARAVAKPASPPPSTSNFTAFTPS